MTKESTALATQEPSSNLPALDASTALTIAQVADEMKAMVITAHHFPRDENAAFSKIMKVCERPEFAINAAYRFQRGGKEIKGPSIHLARTVARIWGHMRSGFRIIEDTGDELHIAGWAYDAEANNYAESPDRFKKLVQRKVGNPPTTRWVEPDERDLRELRNRRGSICMRNALLQLLPQDIVDAALERAEDTLRRSSRGELDQNRTDTIRKLVMSFDEVGVNVAMLEQRLGHAINLVTSDEVAELREVYRSIQDGNTTREDHFEFANPFASQQSPLHAKVQDQQ